MSSSLHDLNWMNLKSKPKGKGKVILFPLIQKFQKKVSNFTQFDHTIKQSIIQVINITFQILGCYKPTTLKMNLVPEIRKGLERKG